MHVATPLEVCEQRDRKGLYAKARAGIIKEFTGIDDPYEAPERAEVTLDTTQATADEAANAVLRYLDGLTECTNICTLHYGQSAEKGFSALFQDGYRP